MSLIANACPHARIIEPIAQGRSGIPTVAWRKMFGKHKLIISIPKALAGTLNFAFTQGSKNYAEVGYIKQDGDLVIANVTNRPDCKVRWTVQNRSGTMVTTLTADWIPMDTPDQRAAACEFRSAEVGGTPLLWITLPDWAAPERADFLAARARGVEAAEAARARASAPQTPPFTMLNKKVA
jgi:hypothetical protein